MTEKSAMGETNMKSFVKSLCLVAGVVLVAGIGLAGAKNGSTQDAAYKVGDRGPAGGWIFHDKGNASDGWRYLEAAPADLGPVAWGCYCKGDVPGAGSQEMGGGKANTAAIIAGCDEPDTAAKIAARYNGGGKTDWYLPSEGELGAIFTNLSKKGVGGFAKDYYWSSTPHGSCFAGLMDFDSGALGHDNRFHKGRVRAVRAF
jgi:hypothetical protein